MAGTSRRAAAIIRLQGAQGRRPHPAPSSRDSCRRRARWLGWPRRAARGRCPSPAAARTGGLLPGPLMLVKVGVDPAVGRQVGARLPLATARAKPGLWAGQAERHLASDRRRIDRPARLRPPERREGRLCPRRRIISRSRPIGGRPGAVRAAAARAPAGAARAGEREPRLARSGDRLHEPPA